MTFLILNWSVLLVCLVGNRERIIKLINDGLKIEEDFKKIYATNPWNLYLILAIYFKDIIYLTGYTYFTISARRTDETYFYYYRIVSAVIYSISFGVVENLKIIADYHVSHLLGILNKSLSRKRKTINLESIKEISKMYERLLDFTENISKLLKYRTTMVLTHCLILTSTEV
jgi:hypothetical protein